MTLLLAGGLIGSTLRDLVRLAGPGGGKSLGPAINLGVGDGGRAPGRFLRGATR